MDVANLADTAIEGIATAVIPKGYAQPRMLIGKRPIPTLKAFMRVLPYRKFIESLGVTINLGEKTDNKNLLGEYNHETKDVINIYSLSVQVWLHEVVHAIDDRIYGIQGRAAREGDGILTWTHEYVADLGAVMLLMSMGRPADLVVAKSRILDHTFKDINERGLEVQGVPFETDEEKARWVCRRSRQAACVCIDYILKKGKP